MCKVVTYFDKVFNFKRQRAAHVQNLHALSQDFYLSCRHALLISNQSKLYLDSSFIHKGHSKYVTNQAQRQFTRHVNNATSSFHNK